MTDQPATAHTHKNIALEILHREAAFTRQRHRTRDQDIAVAGVHATLAVANLLEALLATTTPKGPVLPHTARDPGTGLLENLANDIRTEQPGTPKETSA